MADKAPKPIREARYRYRAGDPACVSAEVFEGGQYVDGAWALATRQGVATLLAWVAARVGG